MNYDIWITYALACAVLSVIPGPSVLLITGLSLTKGLRAALYCIAGETLGGSCLILLSLLGVGAILATSAFLFFFVKWLGVVYLAYLGVREIMKANQSAGQRSGQTTEVASSLKCHSGSFSAGFFTALLNPKAIIFYMAFITQFVDPAADNVIQYTVLIVTSAVVAGFILFGYALVASRAQSALKSRKARRNVSYASGGFYLSGSVLMATTR